MTEHDKNAPDAETPAEAAVTGPGGFAQAQAGSEEARPSEEDVLLRLAKENEELRDQALRLAAEMENLRKRTVRDVHEARSYSIANFARDMLGVSDDLRRALEAVPQEAREAGDAGLKALVEGVEMTERSMLSALERHGVRRLDPQGEKFDPHFHQAMFEVPGDDAPAGTVVQVIQSGFVIGERVLRPAMVGVAKAGPKPQAPAGTEPGAPDL